MKISESGRNVIPRNYYKIVANEKITGDVLHIYKNNYGHLALSEKTGKHFYISANYLRIADFYEFVEVLR